MFAFRVALLCQQVVNTLRDPEQAIKNLKLLENKNKRFFVAHCFSIECNIQIERRHTQQFITMKRKYKIGWALFFYSIFMNFRTTKLSSKYFRIIFIFIAFIRNCNQI